jgi:hypothetical protein
MTPSWTSVLTALLPSIFDLDGTLYTRPPNNLEHDPLGQPAARPYLCSMLVWLLNYSPYHVAIWTGSQKATAVRCLDDLDHGIVGRKLVDPNKDQAELLHPKVVALWAREDFGLTDEDYHSYVAVVKDLDKMWDCLVSSLQFAPRSSLADPFAERRRRISWSTSTGRP